MMSKYEIMSFQVFWLEGSSNYVPESRHILELYGSMVEVPTNAVIFHDEGNALMNDGASIVPLIFNCRAATYPPIIHQYLSPNDNHYHGAAKAKWRQMAAKEMWDKDDSVESSLSLLSVLTHFDREAIRSFFTRNFFLGREKIQPDRCMDLVSSGLIRKLKKSQYFERCLESFKLFQAKSSAEGAITPCSPQPAIESSLDGKYWK